MILTNCRTHPNIYFDVAPLSQPAKNEEARKQYMYWAMEEHKRKQREDVMDRCDRDILYEFCENATKAKGRAAAMGAMFGFGAGIDMANCQVSPTGIYREGFDRTLIGGWPIPAHLGGMQFTPGVGWRQQYAQGLRNSRQLRVTVVRNPTNVAGIKPTDAYGHYYLQDLEEDLRPLVRKTFNKNIVYPVNNFEMQSPIPPYSYSSWATNPRFQQYSGIWTANVTVQDRIDELIEIYGEPPNGFNSTAGVKIINNNVDPDLTAMMDPDTKMFISRMMDINGNEIKSVAGYHNLMAHGPLGSKGLDDFSVVKPTQSIDIKLAGSINDFPNFQTFIHPVMGLTSYSINLSDDGLTTDMSFATRPPEAPKEESILNKIGPRTM
jgi:hypothetical protein